MSEPTQITSAGKRKELHTDGSAKELQASLPITASSRASSLRPDDETQQELTRSAKQATTTKTEVETLQNVSFLFSKGALRTSEEWISYSEDGWYAPKKQEETVEEERR